MSRRVPPGGFFDESPFGRLPTEPSFPTVRLPARTLWWVVGASLLLLLLFLVQPFARLYTDWLWFRALGFSNVFGTRLTAQIVSFFLFAAVFWVAGAVNVLAALGSARRLSSIGIRQRRLTAPATVAALLGVFLLGLLFGRIAAGQWQTILTYMHQTPFGVQDPIWHKDVAFYIFTLPFYRFLWGWALGVVIVLALVSGGVYAYRAGLQTMVLPARAVRHLSLLVAAFAALIAIHYRLDLYELVLGRRGLVYGAGYTDVAARIPAYWIMVGLMVLIAAALLVNVGPARLAALPVALAAWIGAAFILLVIFPGIVQRVQVAPAELDRETPYIRNEIAFTRRAFGLSDVSDIPFTPADSVSAEAIQRNPQTVENARLWDPQLALPLSLQNLQSLRPYYDFSEIAVDRYRIGGQYEQLLLAARELAPQNLPQSAQRWVALKLQYTHGYGVVANRGNKATEQGNPVLTLKDIPPVGEPAVTRSGIYFGRRIPVSDYVFVHSKQPEFDYPGEINQYTQWTGTTGVHLSGLRSLAFALRFGDLNILLSNELTPSTQVLFHRQVQERAATLAPFLRFDSDPYIVVADGRLYWIEDAYTVSDRYPYSQITSEIGTAAGVNYVRNAVKVVVDAYDGSITFYQIDSEDPIIRTYAAIFPGLFKPFAEMPASLQPHIRYPRDLFSIQTQMFQLYHVQDPTVFYTREDLWTVANEVLQQGSAPVPIRPFYVIMRLPGEANEEFFTILPYTPNGKSNMIAYLAARSDAPNYGKLLDFRFPKDSFIIGPQQVESNIEQTPVIKSQFSLLNQPGSTVIRGNLLVLPIENSLLYIEPIYIQADNPKIPQLKKVIVATGQRVAMEDTLDRALASLFGTAPPSGPAGPAPAPGAANATVAQLIAEANQHYQRAQQLLRQGDFAGYANEIQQVGQILQRLQGLQPAPAPSPGSSPGPSPRPSPSR